MASEDKISSVHQDQININSNHCNNNGKRPLQRLGGLNKKTSKSVLLTNGNGNLITQNENDSPDDRTEYSTASILDKEYQASCVKTISLPQSPPRQRKIPNSVNVLVKTFFLPHVRGYFQSETNLPLLKKTNLHCMSHKIGKW